MLEDVKSSGDATLKPLRREYNSESVSALRVKNCRTLDFLAAVDLQETLVVRKQQESLADMLLFVEHHHVYTLGRGGKDAHVLAAEDIPVHRTSRGGDVTYHGPGQIVGYPILDLRPDRCDVHRYVRDLEDVMIRVCADYGVAAGRVSGLSGAWVGAEKIGAIGVRISRWITSHGFAFNVNTRLDDFQLIVPCGIADRGVTSLQKLLGRAVPIEDVEERVMARFAEVFDM